MNDKFVYWLTIAFDLVPGRRERSFYVLGYPGSGTNWVCNIASHYLGLPMLRSWQQNLPAIQPCVIHMHRFLHLAHARSRTIYVLRDGRDALVSQYFSYVRFTSRHTRKIEDKLGEPLRRENVRRLLPGFIRLLHRGDTSTTSYAQHVNHAFRKGYAIVKYEDLLEDGVHALSGVLGRLLGSPVDPDRLVSSLERSSFESQSGRPPGEQSDESFFRKGITGDWRTHFTFESAQVFDELFGEALILAGYEPSSEWVQALRENAPGT